MKNIRGAARMKMNIVMFRGQWSINAWVNGKRTRRMLGKDRETAELIATTYYRYAIIKSMIESDPELRKMIADFIRPQVTHGFVYYIQVGDLVKIGWSRNPTRRAYGIQVGSGTQVVCRKLVKGERRDEALAHHRFDHLRVRGEFFKLEGSLKAFLDKEESHD